MKFLQTGDWHLGKFFFELSLQKDQQFFLDQIENELKKAHDSAEPYDALLMTGDIYDRSVPPAESVTMLSEFISSIRSQFPDLHLFFIAGNHDSSERLSFLKDVLSLQNIHFCTDTQNFTEPVIVKNCAVYQLPYLMPNSIKSPDSDLFTHLKNQQELVSEAVRQIKEAHIAASYKKLPAILSAHLFVAGTIRSESERNIAGNTDQIDSALLDFFDYSALGHIHSYQKVGKHAYYSGAPLSYSFGEKSDSKFMLSVTINDDGSYTTKSIPFIPLHKCTVLKTSMKELCDSTTFPENKDDYVQIICTDNSVISNPVLLLRQKFPNLLSFFYEKNLNAESTNASIEQRRKALQNAKRETCENVFLAFHKEIYAGQEIQDDLLQKEAELYKKYYENL